MTHVKRIEAMDALIYLQKQIANLVGKQGLSMVSKQTSILHDYIENSVTCKTQPPKEIDAKDARIAELEAIIESRGK